MDTGRGRAREHALRIIYEWQLNPQDPKKLIDNVIVNLSKVHYDKNYCQSLVFNTVKNWVRITEIVSPFLDRDVNRLSPIEQAIIFMATNELLEELDTPFKVVIDEAVELARIYGGTGGYKYINGVLDTISAVLRKQEVV